MVVTTTMSTALQFNLSVPDDCIIRFPYASLFNRVPNPKYLYTTQKEFHGTFIFHRKHFILKSIVLWKNNG